MKRLVHTPHRQLGLMLRRDTASVLPEKTRAAIVAALADLLLEALGRGVPTSDEKGDRDESEDHR
jgi:DNA-binding transcriptional ArsR family regulator